MVEANTTELLKKKDEDKSVLLDQIQQVKESLNQGNGKLKITVHKPSFSGHSKVQLAKPALHMALSPLNELVANLEFEVEQSFYLYSKASTVVITLEETDEDFDKAIYTSTLDVNEVPEDSHLEAELDCLDSNNELAFKINIKAFFDSFEGILDTKIAELEKLNAEIDEIKSSTATGAGTATGKTRKSTGGKSSKKSGGGKTKKSTSGGTISSAPDDKDSISMTSTFLGSILNETVQAAGYAFNNRAPILFAFAAATIYFFGEYASV